MVTPPYQWHHSNGKIFTKKSLESLTLLTGLQNKAGEKVFSTGIAVGEFDSKIPSD